MKFALSTENIALKYLLLILLLVKVAGVTFATLVFAKFTPLLDSEFYLSGFYGEGPLRTTVIQLLATTANSLGGVYFAHLTFALSSVFGLAYYYLTGGRRLILVLGLLLPSSLVWTSIVGKEAIFYGAFTLSLVIWVRFAMRRCTTADYVLLAMAAIVCALLRPHYGSVVIWLFVSTVVIERLKNYAWILLLLIAVVASGFVFSFFWESLLLRGFQGIVPTARASRFLYFGIEYNTSIGHDAYKSLVPLGALLGIIGPMPSELIARPVFIPFFVEGMLILISPALIYLYAMKQSFKDKKRFTAIFWLCIVPAILALITLHAPFGVLNPGSATRWRVNFETIFYMAPLLLFYGFLDEEHLENRSLSS